MLSSQPGALEKNKIHKLGNVKIDIRLMVSQTIILKKKNAKFEVDDRFLNKHLIFRALYPSFNDEVGAGTLARSSVPV